MNYTELNLLNKEWIKTTCHNETTFDWEDDDMLTIAIGNLPEFGHYREDSKFRDEYMELKKIYNSYDFFKTDKLGFLESLRNKVENIRKIEPYWMGPNIDRIEEITKMHKSVLIYGEGGIGKSYFVKCLEEELEKTKIKHLCLYGKPCHDISVIDFDEIANIAKKEQFLFVFDAINELSFDNQEKLLKELENIKNAKGLRIIITYRSFMLEEKILNEYERLTESKYKFAGVSFESVTEWFQRIPIMDINEYIDLLYTNNPLLLSKLPYILRDGLGDKNSVIRFTHIYERYIEKILNNSDWQKTKTVAKYLYHNNKKMFSVQEISGEIKDSIQYVSKMEQNGFIIKSAYSEDENYYFKDESLIDFLIARSLFNELSSKPIEECIRIVTEKIESFSYINLEAIILVLFEKFSSDFTLFKKILKETKLINNLKYETIIKMVFKDDEVKRFLETFTVQDNSDLFANFAGFINKPFNCTNYLNEYLFADEERIKELSFELTDKYTTRDLVNRLKNILYFTSKCECSKERTLENFYTAFWGTASPNETIRKLSTKILYETMLRDTDFIDDAISSFNRVSDEYIKEAIIHALSFQVQDNRIIRFFNELLSDCEFIQAKSIKRISVYLGNKYGYINCNKKNVFIESSKDEASNEFRELMHTIDLYDKELLPFRVWGDTFESYTKFLKAEKSDVIKFNSDLKRDFCCVKDGACNGRMSIHKDIEKIYKVSFYNNLLDEKSLIYSMEKVYRNVFSKYGQPLNKAPSLGADFRTFGNSVLKKCVIISNDLFYGSLMCNYFTNEFATYNNYQESIGYEIYDPIEYGEELNIATPVCVYQQDVEKMDNLVLKNIESPVIADEKWWKDLKLTERNIVSVLTPIKYNEQEWYLLAARIAKKDHPENYIWEDIYDIYCCCSENETLMDDGNERKLTIDIEEYLGNPLEYHNWKEQSWLCKRINSIDRTADVFDESLMILPPSEIVSTLGLKFDLLSFCWENKNDEKVIICNNNKASYYHDYIMGTVFIRKDAYEEFQKLKTIKYFAFSQRLLRNRGFCVDTEYHFEIVNGKIVKEIPNIKSDYEYVPPKFEKCETCKYGFYDPVDFEDSITIEYPDEIKELLSKYGK